MENDKLLRHHEVISMVNRSNDYILRKEKTGEFPKRFKIDKYHVRWNRHEIEEWLVKSRGMVG